MLLDTAHCPYCGHEMSEVYYAISGMVKFCHSRTAMEFLISGRRPDLKMTPPAQFPVAPQTEDDRKPHVVVGVSGYRVGEWPKEGLYCFNCGTMTVKLKS